MLLIFALRRNSTNLWYSPPTAAQTPPQHRNEVDNSKALYEERRQYYNTQSLPHASTSREQSRQPVPPPQQQQAAQPPQPSSFINNDVQLRQSNVVRELNHRNSYLNTRPVGPNVPDPDYSPPMPRANPFDNRPQLRSAMRTSRF